MVIGPFPSNLGCDKLRMIFEGIARFDLFEKHPRIMISEGDIQYKRFKIDLLGSSIHLALLLAPIVDGVVSPQTQGSPRYNSQLYLTMFGVGSPSE